MERASPERRQLQRELAQHLREKDRAALGQLRARIKSARAERQQMLHAARATCRTALVSLRERQAAQRRLLTLEHQAEREAGRVTCATGKSNAKETGLELEHAAQRAFKDERSFQRQIRHAGRPARERTTARERSQEDDDAVRNNLPPELVPVFDKYRKSFKGSAKRSRTEAFLEWAEENPDEILVMQQAEADRALKELLRQQRDLGRTVRSAGRYKRTPADLARLLAEVPF
jgi:hypothetical protein